MAMAMCASALSHSRQRRMIVIVVSRCRAKRKYAFSLESSATFTDSTLEKNSMYIQNKLFVLAVTLLGALSVAACGKTDDSPMPETRTETAPETGTMTAPETRTAPAPEAETTVGTDIDDATITTKVKSALLADDDVKGLDIKVETHKGEVQLSGFVDSQSQIDRAIAVTRDVEGVTNVDDKMSVKTTETTIGEKVDDALITTKVKAALLAEPNFDSGDISVETRDNEVQLSGLVNDETQIDRALQVARGVEGVRNVINKLSVKGQ